MYGERLKLVSELIEKRVQKYVKENPDSALTRIPKQYKVEAWCGFGYPNKSFWVRKEEVNNFVRIFSKDGRVILNDATIHCDSVSRGVYYSADKFREIDTKNVFLYWVYMYIYSSNGRQDTTLRDLAGMIKAVGIDMPYNISNLWIGCKNYGYEVRKTLMSICDFRSKFVKVRFTREIDFIIKLIEQDTQELLDKFEIVHVDDSHADIIMYDGDRIIFSIVKNDKGELVKNEYN